MKTFDDLRFNNTSDGMMQAVMRFPNGYGVSVIYGPGALSDDLHPYEIAAILFNSSGKFSVIYPDFCDQDVSAYQTKAEVSNFMMMVQEL